MIINISIVDKRPTVEGSPVIVCGNSGYWVNFIFDSEWLELDPKTARFVYTQDGEVKYTDQVFSGNQVEIPILSNIREVRVGVFAGELRTTAPAKIPCEGSIRCGTGAPADPTSDQYDQIMQLLSDSGVTSGLSMSDVVDSLTSAETTKPLSANQGRVLNGKIADNAQLITTMAGEVGNHEADTNNPHKVTKSQVGLGNVPNVATNDQTPTYSDTTTLATLSSGEKLNVALQKIKCAITNLINHIGSHKLNTYTSFSEIGLTYGEETIADIATNTPANSEVLITIGADNPDIYPLTYGVLHVLKKDVTRVIFKFYSKTTAYEYLGVYDSTMTNPWSGWVYGLGKDDVVDNLLSASTNMPLSAKQGKVLDEKIATNTTGISELNTKLPFIQYHTISELSINADATVEQSITFETPYSNPPLVSYHCVASGYRLDVVFKNVTATTCVVWITNNSGSNVTNRSVRIMSIGV